MSAVRLEVPVVRVFPLEYVLPEVPVARVFPMEHVLPESPLSPAAGCGRLGYDAGR